MRTVLGLLAVILVLATGCATTQRQTVEQQPAICAFLGDSCNELEPGASGEASLRWINPKTQPTQYDKVLVEVVGFFGSDKATVPLKDQQTLTDLFRTTLNVSGGSAHGRRVDPGRGPVAVWGRGERDQGLVRPDYKRAICLHAGREKAVTQEA